MECLMCGANMKKNKSSAYHYTECGLSKIYLEGIQVWSCTNSECEEEELEIPNIEELHELMAINLASQRHKLLPEEIRFLRSYLGFSGADFANIIGVTPETVTRWEKGQVNMKEASERLLRVLVLSKVGPFRNYEDLAIFATNQRKTAPKRSFKITKEQWRDVAA